MAMRGPQKLLARIFWRRIGMVALFALILAAILAVWSVYGKERESRGMRSEAETRLEELRAQEQTLSNNIESLKTDRGREAILREQYGVAKEDEGLIIVVEAEKSTPAPQERTVGEWVRRFLPFW